MQNKELVEMVLPYQNKLYRFALSIVGNRFEAEDIVQEVLIKIWKRKEQFVQLGNKEAWCMTVTRNLAIDKKRSRKVIHDDIESHYDISDNSSSPSQLTEFNDTMHYIREAMNELPVRQKEVLHLRDIEGCSYQEISEVTGHSVDIVKVSLHRARKALRLKIENLR